MGPAAQAVGAAAGWTLGPVHGCRLSWHPQASGTPAPLGAVSRFSSPVACLLLCQVAPAPSASAGLSQNCNSRVVH
eukprot:13051083-Alexandrium_andersonii.AAC.1